MHFKEFLKQSADEIDLELQSFFKEWSKETELISPRLAPQLKALQDACSGGKRIRGAMVILGYSLVSKTPNQELLKIAIAYELFQTAILAHDDIIDHSPTRRGKPSLHMALGGESYGVAQAICLGDIGFFLAYKLISESNFEEALKGKTTAFFSDSIIKTTLGEMLDVELAFEKETATIEDILTVTRLKTAYYTFVAPLTLGAILAGAEETFLKSLAIYGEAVGVAFQLKDDINDVFGSETTLKKKIGGDIIEGKQTMLIKKAEELANEEQGAVLEKYYGTATIDEKGIEQVKDVFRQTGALSYTQQLAKDYGKKAQASIAAITTERHLQTMLEEVIDYIV